MGFPSPAQDFYSKETDTLSLDHLLIHRPAATFFFNASGSDLTEAGIIDGAILIVDRSLHPNDGDIVVARLDDEFICRRLFKSNNEKIILSGNSDVTAIEVNPEQDFEIWGVVSSAVNRFRNN